MRSISLFLTVLLAGAALAGCALPGGDDETPTPTTTEATPSPIFGTPTPTASTPVVTPTTPTFNATTYELAVSGAPAQAKPGQRVNFTLYANGTLSHVSDHIGAHYANNTTSPPNATQMQTCEHANGTLPGTFNVSCAFGATGAWHVYGHARIAEGNDTLHYWAAPFVVNVRDYNVTLSGVPASARPATNFTVNLTVTGFDNVTSDHIGVHWFNDTTTEPTTESAAGACAHVNTGILGNHTITCSISLPALTPTKDYYLRGHVRVTEGGVVLSWWSDPTKITIAPVGLGGLPG